MMIKWRRWTSEDDALLRSLPKTGMTQARAAELLGRTTSAVNRRVNRLGVQCIDWKPAPSHPWRRPLTKKGHEIEAGRVKA